MIMTRAALALLALAALAAIDARSAAAEIYRPWCVQYQGSRNGSTSCAFTSFEQCMMTAGPETGGVCVQNPWYLWYGPNGTSTGGVDSRFVDAVLRRSVALWPVVLGHYLTDVVDFAL
jgi:Protein of unknown function (DUF3551)